MKASHQVRGSGLGDSLGAEVYGVVKRILESPLAGFEVRPSLQLPTIGWAESRPEAQAAESNRANVP